MTDVDTDPVPLLVPPGAADVLAAWAALFPVSTAPVFDRAFDRGFAVEEYALGRRLVAGLAIELVALRHAAPNCGIRVSDGERTLAYTGDTGPAPALVDLAHGADLLLAEGTLDAADHEHGHLDATEAARVAAAAGVGELVLTHWTTADPHRLPRSGGDTIALTDDLDLFFLE